MQANPGPSISALYVVEPTPAFLLSHVPLNSPQVIDLSFIYLFTDLFVRLYLVPKKDKKVSKRPVAKKRD